MSIPRIYEIIRKDFIQYLNLKERQISPRTQARYLSDIEYYINNYINTTTLINELPLIFIEQRLKSFLKNRKSSTARATLKHFLGCLYENKRIDDSTYIRIHDYLKKLGKTSLEKQMEFLNDEQLNFIFSKQIEYKNKESAEKLILPLVVSMAYNFLFEQEHLIKLKWSDINLNERKVRNLRSELDDTVVKWIEMNNKTYELIKEYQKSCTRKYKMDDSFLYIKNQPANNTTINSILYIFKHKANFNAIKTSVDIQKIHRSRILKELLLTEGKSTIDFIKILGLRRNTQLEHALEEYLMYEYSKISSVSDNSEL